MSTCTVFALGSGLLHYNLNRPAGGPADEPQAAGCGGFGKGNFHELFKRIEDYERTLNIGS